MKNTCIRSVDFAAEPEENDDGRTLRGYGAVFGQATHINNHEGNFHETVAPGAFRKTLQERTPVMQFDHGHDPRTGTVPIAAIKELREDPKGLFVRARMFDNPVVEPIRQAIADGALSGMSFNFRVTRDEWRDSRGNPVRPEELGRLLYDGGERGPLQRTLKEVQLNELGPVVRPAYPGTSVGVRHDEEDEVDKEKYIASLMRSAYSSQELAESVERAGGPQTPPGPAGPPTPSPLPGDKAVEAGRAALAADPDGDKDPNDTPADPPQNVHDFVDGNCANCGY